MLVIVDNLYTIQDSYLMNFYSIYSVLKTPDNIDIVISERANNDQTDSVVTG